MVAGVKRHTTSLALDEVVDFSQDNIAATTLRTRCPKRNEFRRSAKSSVIFLSQQRHNE